INQDGLTDLVLCFHATQFHDSGFQVILTNPSDYLRPTISGIFRLNNQGAVAVADMNGDGHPDVVVNGGSANNVFTVAYGNGTGNFSTSQNINLDPFNDFRSSGGGRVVVGDLNADGLPDVALVAKSTSSGTQVVSIYFQNSLG